jgi:ATP-dependent Clp protease protease subunit
MTLHIRTEADEPEAEPAAPAVARPTLADDVGRRLLDQRRVLLFGPVDQRSANAVCAQLLLLEAEDPSEPITLVINSPGGSVDDGFSIYDTMQALTCDVVTIGTGLVASMGQFLLCAGAPGKRYAHAHASILMHQPHGQVQGMSTDIAIHAAHFARTRRTMAELIAQHTGQSVHRITADADRDRWFTAQEALDYGMVDHIL